MRDYRRKMRNKRRKMSDRRRKVPFNHSVSEKKGMGQSPTPFFLIFNPRKRHKTISD
jgi:hypothetical protein